MTEQRDLVGHLVEVRTLRAGRRHQEGSFRAECECGWSGRVVRFVGQAVDEAGMHRLAIEHSRSRSARRPPAAEDGRAVRVAADDARRT